MSPAPIGALVTISPYDWQSSDPSPEEGEYLRTLTTRGTTGGTIYLIVAIREIHARTRLPFKVRARYRIRAVKIGPYRDWEQPAGARVLTLKWNDRNNRRGT